MVSRRDVVLCGALAISLGANVVLLMRKTDAAPPATAVESKASVEATPARSPSAVPKRVRAPRSPTGSESASPCPELVAQLEATEAELDKFLPANERWERYPRSEANEARVRPLLDNVFTDSGKGRGYQVECHELVCKVVVDRAIARDDWMQALQQDPARMGMIDGWMFGRDVYMTLKANPPTANEKLALAFYAALNTPEPFEACTKAHKDPGNLTITVSLDAAARRLQLTIGGSLARSPLANCIRPLIEAAIATTPVPVEVTEFEPFTWPFVVK
jgi:hypothetical protein